MRLALFFLLAAVAGAQVVIGGLPWQTDYEQARQLAAKEHKWIWLHFGENPG